MMAFTKSQKGFSTLLALMMTGFLVVLSAGVLFLFLSESQISRSLSNGISAYHAAEGSLELALLKIKNHREGFQDTLTKNHTKSIMLDPRADTKSPTISYEISGNISAHTGSLRKEGFEIIPLFIDRGTDEESVGTKVYKRVSSLPNIDPVADLNLAITGPSTLVWNLIGNDVSGKTFGIAGKISDITPVNASTVGRIRILSSGTLSESSKTVGSFLATYKEVYLVLYNPGNPVSYEISSAKPFSLPTTRIVASGRVLDSSVHLELTQNKSSLFDALKYSVFVTD